MRTDEIAIATAAIREAIETDANRGLLQPVAGMVMGIIETALGSLTDEPKVMACPKCGERSNVEGGPVEIDCDAAWQNVTCLSCGCEYVEVYSYDHTEIDGEEVSTWKPPVGEG